MVFYRGDESLLVVQYHNLRNLGENVDAVVKRVLNYIYQKQYFEKPNRTYELLGRGLVVDNTHYERRGQYKDVCNLSMSEHIHWKTTELIYSGTVMSHCVSNLPGE